MAARMSGGSSPYDPAITWADVLARPREFVAFEDPISAGAMVDRQQFYEAYSAALDSLDGSDLMAFVDYFFAHNPMVAGTWSFKDDEVREDFYDICLDAGCTLTVKEIQEGESTLDKSTRKAREADIAGSSDEELEHRPQQKQKQQKQSKPQPQPKKVTKAAEPRQKEQSAAAALVPAKSARPKKGASGSLVPPPLVEGVEHASKRTLVTAYTAKYGKGDGGRRALHAVQSRDRVMREFVDLITLLDSMPMSDTQRAAVNAKLDCIVTLLEHSA